MPLVFFFPSSAGISCGSAVVHRQAGEISVNNLKQSLLEPLLLFFFKMSTLLFGAVLMVGFF